MKQKAEKKSLYNYCLYISSIRLTYMSLETDIKQTKFRSPFQKLYLNLIYTSNCILYHQLDLFRSAGLSTQQYNVLRILRGQAGKPIKLNDISCRMLDKTSNVSRLVDKLLEKGLLDRTVCPGNRRAVNVTITKEGLDVLAKLDPEVEAWEESFSVFTLDQANQLNDWLDQLRTIVRKGLEPVV